MPRPSGKDKAVVKAKCFDVQVSFPCAVFGVGEWPAERQRSIWDTKMRKKHVPSTQKCVKNAYP